MTTFAATSANVSGLLLGAVFLFAGIAKFIRLSDFSQTLRSFGIGGRWVHLVSLIVAAAEIGLGFVLVFGLLQPWAQAVAILMLAVFSALVARLLAKRVRTNCGCMGSLNPEIIGVHTIVRNLSLTLAGLASIASPFSGILSIAASIAFLLSVLLSSRALHRSDGVEAIDVHDAADMWRH